MMTQTSSARRLEVLAPASTADAKILVVDDDERNLLALAEVLAPLAEIVTVTSGRDALRALLRDDFAVILLDVFMPDMDGYETAALIREREQTARIPIIFLSAVNKDTEHLMRGYAMGAVDYVFKPVDPLVLRSKAAVFVDLHTLRREVEERNRAEQELREANLRAEEERLDVARELQATRLRQAAILNSLPVVLFEASHSKDGSLRRRVVGGGERIMAEDTASWIRGDDIDWEERILPEDREAVDREYTGKMIAGASATARYRWASDGGVSHHFLEHAVLIGEDIWVGSIIDVTAQSELENQLFQTQKLDALGQLTGGLAHDFNNLLAAIVGGLELLRMRGGLSEPATEIVAQMREAADQGTDLIKSLLAFARKQPLAPSPVDPQLLRQSVLALAERALGASFKVEWITLVDDCAFYADRSQLTLAILNLIINGRDAMPDGGVIEIVVDRPKKAVAPSEMLRISVRDHGCGIPPELEAKVTEPFFTTKEPGKGTGLGLSMVAGFAEQSGGSLSFQRPAGGGTRVQITLPCVAPSPEEKTKSGEPADRTGNECRSILLVDDDERVRTVLTGIMEDMGVSVTAAVDGQAALDELRCRKKDYDLVLSDVAMPRMNGIELVNMMQRENIGVPVKMMTGNPSPQLIGQFPQGTEVLTKPLRSDVIKTLLAGI